MRRKLKPGSRHHAGPTREKTVCNASISPMIPPTTRAWQSLINWRNSLAKSVTSLTLWIPVIAARAESGCIQGIRNYRQGSTFSPRREPFSEWRSLSGTLGYPFNERGLGYPGKLFTMLKVRISLRDKKIDSQPWQHPTGGKPQRGIDIGIPT